MSLLIIFGAALLCVGALLALWDFIEFTDLENPDKDEHEDFFE